MRAGSDDDGLCMVSDLAGLDELVLASEINALDSLLTDLDAEALGVCAHLVHQIGAGGVASRRIVGDLGGGGDATADAALLQDDGLKQGAAAVETSRQACRATADDDEVEIFIGLFHLLPLMYKWWIAHTPKSKRDS